MRDAVVTLPPGFVGNPQAIPQCPRQKFEGERPSCPGSTQVGVLRAIVSGLGEINGPIFNVAPPPGVAAQFGFSSTGFTSLQYAFVRGEEDYRLSVVAPDLPLEASSVTATFWGTPADHSHDPERTCINESGVQFEGCSSDAIVQPYLTLPASCGTAPETRVEVDSKQNPGVFVGESAPARDSGGNPAPMLGCEAVPFTPEISSRATSSSAGSASGLDFELELPNEGLLTPGGTAETQPHKTEVTLPAGVTVNPSAANGIAACTPAQYKAESAGSLPGQGCPEASKVGTLFAKTPLLEEAIEGSVYLAAPRDNPFDSFLAIYIVARVPERGILVKQAGEVRADPLTRPADDDRRRSAADPLLLLRTATCAKDLGHRSSPPSSAAPTPPPPSSTPSPRRTPRSKEPPPSRSAPAPAARPAPSRNPSCQTTRRSKRAPPRRWPAPTRPSSSGSRAPTATSASARSTRPCPRA